MKELNLKIKTCQDCPYATVANMGFACDESGEEKGICSLDEHLDKVGLPEWCPLKDMREQGVKVGISVFIFNENNELLIGYRTPDNLWGLPGGGMIAGETPKETAVRETEEETSIIIDPQKIYFATFTNDIFLEEKNEHWITLYFICECSDWTGAPERVEPDKCSEWKWSNLDSLPQNLFCEWGKFIPELKNMTYFSRR